MIKICVIGLGYVGLPVALGISSKFETLGFDISEKRIKELSEKYDSNKEYYKKDFIRKKITFSNKTKDLEDSNVYIICVPTPIKKNNLPDLSFIKKSISIISTYIKSKDIVVLESTVYPGVTEHFAKFLELKTGLKNNKDFYLCYSPERINPGDKTKKIKDINKVFAINTSNKSILLKIKKIYKLISKKIIFSKKIKEAETAKAIENTQRDLNIALFNEILILSQKINLDFKEIIKLAETKWNFIKFQPGLVGGHCLPVDPYYLSYIAKKNKFKTNTLLSGRSTNNNMRNYVSNEILKCIKKSKLNNKAKILILGISYKYGVSDLRNSLGLKIFNKIKQKYKNTYFYDPFVNIKNKYTNIKNLKNFKLIVFLSSGKKYRPLFRNAIKNNLLILDPFNYFS
ncbi:nucleotide sugar dehydrogenase [Candidatus Pelagibacter sp.]|uniref:nucleotide sugar dehydrogenase n=1 Tax=Candidatus Pelagibacter sp. TaxID=2024849 RepID=UPI003F835DE0